MTQSKTFPAAEADSNCRNSLGCWGDSTHDRAISGDIRLEGTHDNIIEACHNFAKENGWTVFAVEFRGQCFTSADAESTYKKHGERDFCEDGTGGANAMNVYKIVNCPGKISVKVKSTFVSDIGIFNQNLPKFAFDKLILTYEGCIILSTHLVTLSDPTNYFLLVAF